SELPPFVQAVRTASRDRSAERRGWRCDVSTSDLYVQNVTHPNICTGCHEVRELQYRHFLVQPPPARLKPAHGQRVARMSEAKSGISRPNLGPAMPSVRHGRAVSRLLEWRVWREPEGFSRNQRASWYQSTLFGRRRRVAEQRGATAAALHIADGALCLLERRAQGLCRGG